MQCLNVLLLATLLSIAPCLDIYNSQTVSCFADSSWDAIPFFPGDPVEGSSPESAARRVRWRARRERKCVHVNLVKEDQRRGRGGGKRDPA